MPPLQALLIDIKLGAELFVPRLHARLQTFYQDHQ
jgi:hypothetical protein